MHIMRGRMGLIVSRITEFAGSGLFAIFRILASARSVLMLH